MSTPLADPADMDMVVPAASISKIVTETRKQFLLAASDEAYTELARVCTLPLASWSAEIRHKVATIGTYEAASSLNFDIANQGSSLLRRAEAARTWFKGLKAKPPGVVDSTPDEDEAMPTIVTSVRRGW